MCIACTEFIKATLTVQEFRSALRETTLEDPRHLQEVEQVLQGYRGNSDDALRKQLQKVLAD